jgi:para-aminobenzoate synthetase/4-amino-4-deoxychorismate lyase
MFHDFPSADYGLIAGRDNVVFLETSRYDADNYRSFLFLDPIDTLRACSVDEVPGLLAGVEKYLARNCYLAGYFGYECGYHFEEIADSSATPSPLAWFGVYPAPIVFNHLTGTFDAGHDALRASARDGDVPGEYAIGDLRCDIPADEYFRTVGTIKDLIRSGCTYQINFTTKYVFEFHGSTMALYDALKQGQRVSYGAFIRADGRTVLSFSPELFFRRKDDTIITKPMKGTARRGRTRDEDLGLREWLRNDPKNRAENVMIVDLLRNDVGRIAETGSVNVRELFAVEKYQTLFQMTSTVEGRIRSGVTYRDIFQSLFPSGSVTGAPKIRSMQIIRQLENEPRGVYTGAIGYFSPASEAVFNVAIRTVVIDGGRGEMGVGGGIVCDSSPEEEYGECQLKAEFLTTRHEEFGLIETLLWDDGYRLLSRHMRRISESAGYFDYPCDVERLIKSLVAKSREFASGKRYKVRLTLDRHGNVTVESWVIDEREPGLPRVALAGVRTDSKDRFLYHKTTRREIYDRLYRVAAGRGLADVIFMNEKSQVTEGTISNVFIRRGKDLITPSVQCGLLNGVYRQHLIETHPGVREGVLSLDDLRDADAIYICNAIRGLRAVTLCEQYLAPGSDSDAVRAGRVCEQWTRS